MRNDLLPALDASNPLGYLAALGLLRVLDADADARNASRPRLGFIEQGTWIASLVSDLDLDQVVAAVLTDCARQADNPMLQLAYDDDSLLPPSTKGASRDLKPAPDVAREALERAARTGRPRVANLAAACFSELIQDNNGYSKPTGFHFTAGQQEFLRMVEELRAGIRDADVREALIGPWTASSRLPSLSWDPNATRMYALRARDPSTEKRGSVPAANWLAVQALEYFPVAVERNRLVTTRIKGGWKDSVFTWPVWDQSIEHETLRSLQRLDSRSFTAKERAALGISVVFSSEIRRTDQGGYGSFTPSSPVPSRPRLP